MILANVAGQLELAPQAQELLALVERFGGRDAATLQSAVYEFEDAKAASCNRTAAKSRLLRFLAQLGGVAKDVSTDLLAKYLESKGL
jgi:hypothetical protein